MRNYASEVRAGARPGMTCLVQKGVARMSEPLRHSGDSALNPASVYRLPFGSYGDLGRAYRVRAESH